MKDMSAEKKYKDSQFKSDLKSVTSQKDDASAMESFIEQIHSLNGLHLLASVSQILLGVAVVVLSLLNIIQPLWLATFMTVFGSITSMIGVYFLYRTITKSGAFDSLLQQAIRRVIRSQN
jgi:hypothetical protein